MGNIRKSLYLALFSILFLALATGGFAQENKIRASECALDETLLEQQAEALLDSMTTEQKVCQMFIVTPEALTNGAVVTSVDETARNYLKECPVGGLVYFSKNLTDAEQTKELLRSMQAFAMEIEGLP